MHLFSYTYIQKKKRCENGMWKMSLLHVTYTRHMMREVRAEAEKKNELLYNLCGKMPPPIMVITLAISIQNKQTICKIAKSLVISIRLCIIDEVAFFIPDPDFYTFFGQNK